MSQSFLVKGISFAFDTSDANDRILLLYRIDDNNKYILHKTTDNRIEFKKIISGVTTTLQTSVQSSFLKWQVFNILVTIDENNGTKLSILKNNSTRETVSSTDKTILHGNANLYLHNNDGTLQSNAFLQGIWYLPNVSYWDDTLGDNILHGLSGTGFENPELASGFTGTTMTINVLPNNQYQLTCNLDNKYFTIQEFYNNILLVNSLNTSGFVGDDTTTVVWNSNTNTYVQTLGDVLNGTFKFITSAKTNNIKITLSSAFASPDTISLRRCD